VKGYNEDLLVGINFYPWSKMLHGERLSDHSLNTMYKTQLFKYHTQTFIM